MRASIRTTVDRYVRPESLLQGLSAHLRASGVNIRENTPVSALRRTGKSWSAVTAEREISARYVVVATGAAANTLLRPIGLVLPLVAAKGYSVLLQGIGTAPRTAIYLTEPKIGISAYRDGTRFAGFLELPGRNTDVSGRRIKQLVHGALPYLAEWRPAEGELEGEHGWAGMRPATPDGLPCIGPVPGAEGVLVAAGHGMLGVTLAPATANLIAEFITSKRQPPDALPFLPQRTI